MNGPLKGLNSRGMRVTGQQYYLLFKMRYENFAHEHISKPMSTLSDTEHREIFDEIAESIRVDCHLDMESHQFLKKAMESHFFGKTKDYWVKK